MSDRTGPATLQFAAGSTLPAGQIVEIGISADEFMAKYADTHHEWVKGIVIQTSPTARLHNLLIRFLDRLFDAYLEARPIAETYTETFPMRLSHSIREPDLMVILTENPGNLTGTAMIGPADICIEVVSEESHNRDYGDRYREYEQAGVREYWIIDPLRNRVVFHRLDADGSYVMMLPDEDGRYRTPLLPGFALPLEVLWQDPLPRHSAVGKIVAEMLREAD